MPRCVPGLWFCLLGPGARLHFFVKEIFKITETGVGSVSVILIASKMSRQLDEARRIRELEAALADRDHQLLEQQRVVDDIVAGRHGGGEDPISVYPGSHHVIDPPWLDANQVVLRDSQVVGASGPLPPPGGSAREGISDEDLARYLQAQEDAAAHEVPSFLRESADIAAQETLDWPSEHDRSEGSPPPHEETTHIIANNIDADPPHQVAEPTASIGSVAVVVDPVLGQGRTLGGGSTAAPPSWAADVRARRADRLGGGNSRAAISQSEAGGQQGLQQLGPAVAPRATTTLAGPNPAPRATTTPSGPNPAPRPTTIPAGPNAAPPAAPAAPPSFWFSWGTVASPPAVPPPAHGSPANPLATPAFPGGASGGPRGVDRPPDASRVEMLNAPLPRGIVVPSRGAGRRLDGILVPANVGFDSDAALAARLQQEEMLYAQQQQRQQHHGGMAGDVPEVVDPVWGRFTPRNSHSFTALEVMGLSCCPCCVPPVCSPDRKDAYRRIGSTAAFWLSVLQVCVVGSQWGVGVSNSTPCPLPLSCRSLSSPPCYHFEGSLQLASTGCWGRGRTPWTSFRSVRSCGNPCCSILPCVLLAA